MSVGAAIVIVGALAMFVFGPPWFRKLVLVLVAITIVVGGSFLFVIADPQAVAPVGCKNSWGRSFLPEAVCQQVAGANPALASNVDPVPTCTAEQMLTIKDWATSTKGHLFDDLTPGKLFTPAMVSGLDAPCSTSPVPTCTAEQVAKIEASTKLPKGYRLDPGQLHPRRRPQPGRCLLDALKLPPRLVRTSIYNRLRDQSALSLWVVDPESLDGDFDCRLGFRSLNAAKILPLGTH